MKQQSQRKMRQQERFMVSLLTDIKLKLKEGTHKTPVRISVEETCTVPTCVTKASSPFGR